MKRIVHALLLIGVSVLFISGTIDLDNLFNYENQSRPGYITKDNTPDSNLITDEGATLGRVLFYDKKLSSDNSVSCSTCHQQQFAFGDTARFSVGVNNITRRHSMRLVNIRFAEDNLFRWDRSAPTLEEQMIIPIKNFDEMGYSGEGGAPDFQDLIEELSATDYYPQLFNLAFGDEEITEERMARALAQFVRSIESFDSKYDEGRMQVAHDSIDFPNFSASENNGKRLFIDSFSVVTDTITVMAIGTGELEEHAASRRVSGGFNCASCHRPPEFDIDPASLNNGFTGGNGNFGILNDFTITRSPTIRDILDTEGNVHGPLFHSGFTNNLSGLNIYNFRKINPDNNNLDPRYTPNGLPQWLDMTNQERTDLIAFLETLSGTDVYTNEKWSDPFDENGDINVIGGNISSISEDAAEEKLVQIFPNPTQDYFIIQSELPVEKIEIFDVKGKVLSVIQSMGYTHSVDITSLPSGLYFVRVEGTSGKLLCIEKLIVKK